MMPYDTYRLYLVGRAKSPAEVRRADEQTARVASAMSSLLRGITLASASRAQAIPGRRAQPAPPGLTSWPVQPKAAEDTKRNVVAGLA
jgi:hypothetical protein